MHGLVVGRVEDHEAVHLSGEPDGLDVRAFRPCGRKGRRDRGSDRGPPPGRILLAPGRLWPRDVVLAGSGLEDEFLDRAKVVDMGGTPVPLIDVGDLIIAKVLAGRPKDVDDASAVWRLHHLEIDANRIRRTLRLLEEALTQSDLVSTFEAIAR